MTKDLSLPATYLLAFLIGKKELIFLLESACDNLTYFNAHCFTVLLTKYSLQYNQRHVIT